MEWIQSIDGEVLLWIQENLRHPLWTPFWKTVTFLGDRGWFWILTAVTLILIKKTRPAGIMSLCSLGLGALINNIFLKNIAARPRPFDTVNEIVPLIEKPLDYSFPSGHTCASFACALVLWRVLPGKKGLPFLILAFLISLSRLYLGVHYPTDILGGAFVGMISSMIVYELYQKYMRKA